MRDIGNQKIVSFLRGTFLCKIHIWRKSIFPVMDFFEEEEKKKNKGRTKYHFIFNLNSNELIKIIIIQENKN